MMTDLTELNKQYEEWKRTNAVYEEIKAERETLPMANECGENCACSQERANFMTSQEFVERYANAMNAYLVDMLGKRPAHIEDLSAHACSFTDAFFAITSHFTGEM